MDIDQFVRYFFIVSLFLIAVVYFAGFGSNVNVIAHGLQTISYAFTGRNASGQFAGYPAGGNAPSTSL